MGTVSFKYIPLTHGLRAKVSVDDWYWLRHYTWYADLADHTSYAKTTVQRPKEGGGHYRTTLRMHRLITRAPPGLHVDHINNKGLDNRRENLRVVQPFENAQNRVFGKVPYRGVTLTSKRGKPRRYRAKIKNPYTGVHEHLGMFDDVQRAARAYDMRALELYGIFYGLNFPRETYNLEGAITHPEPDPDDIPF